MLYVNKNTDIPSTNKNTIKNLLQYDLFFVVLS